MNPFSAIGKAIIRYRRTRGFGIHSPFAYSFITSVIRCRYPFYCWDELEANIRHRSSIKWNEAKILFRTLNQANPSAVYISPDDRSHVESIVKAWNEHCPITCNVSEADFFIITTDDTGISPDTIANKGATAWFSSVKISLWGRLLTHMQRGQTFTNRTSGIAFCNPKLPLHHFDINY